MNTGRIWLKGETFEGSAQDVAELAAQGFLEGAPSQARKPEPKAVEPTPEPEAPEAPDYGAMTVNELLALCAKRGVKVSSKAKKDVIIAALEG